MELTFALQESQRWITAWQTPLLFVVVQLIIVLIFYREHSSAEAAGEDGEQEQAQRSDFWSSMHMPSQLARLPSFSSSVAVAALPGVVMKGLRSWARRASRHVSTAAALSIPSC